MRTAVIYIFLSGIWLMAQDEAVVRFANGDQLTGEVQSLTLEKLTWKSKILEEPAEFGLKHVLELNMPAAMGVEDADVAEHEAVLEMTNGDTIKGQLSGLTDDEISLKTWYAGNLVFRRVNVESVKITRTSEIHYRGPTGIDEWTQSNEAIGWTFKAGELVSEGTSGIAREIDFPDECKIAFDATWNGAFRPRIIFFSNDVKTSSPTSGYEMVFQGNSVHVKKAGSNTWLGHSTNAGVLRENESARIEIRASIKSGKILLFVDDEFIDMWEDDAVKADALGKGFHLITQDNSPLRISNILVSEWDGYTDNLPEKVNRFQGGRGFRGNWDFEQQSDEEDKEEEELNEGRMVLLNGDSIEGEVLGIEGEIIRLKTPLAEVSFPVSRLKNIVLKPADMETPKFYSGDVRATLSDGSRMVFRLDGVNGDSLVGFSQNFGKAEFAKGAFKRIEFNIHNRNLEHLRGKSGR